MVAFLPFFSQIGAIVLQISLKRIELESCACTQINALEEGSVWFYPDDAGDLSKRGGNAANLISGGSGLFCPYFLLLVPWFC